MNHVINEILKNLTNAQKLIKVQEAKNAISFDEANVIHIELLYAKKKLYAFLNSDLIQTEATK